MPKSSYESGLSQLEQEFELQMDELGLDEGREIEEEWEEPGNYEEDLGRELEIEGSDYADRFYELSQMGYESDTEVDEKVNELLGEMEREYFFGGIKNFLKKRGKGLLQKGLKYAAGQIPALKALQGVTQLARGDLKGMLGSLAKAGLASAIPGGAAVLPALNALGFEATEDPEANREAWSNYQEVCREAFEHLGQNLNENADDPLEASRLAANAFQTAVRQVTAGLKPGRTDRNHGYSKGRRRVVYLAPGEYVVIKRR